jgi:subtilisin family serine protease
MRTILAQFFAGILFLSAPATSFAFDVIVSGLDSTSTADIQTVTRLPQVSNVRSVFSPDEQQMLTTAGRAALAGSMKFSVLSERTLADLNALVAKRHLRVRLEAAEITLRLDGPKTFLTPEQAAELSRPTPGSSFASLQWGIKNVGQLVPIALDDLTSKFVKGKVGEDTGVTRAPKESKDPKRRVKIAILDTGVDFAHPELLDRVIENTAECRALAQFTKCLKDAEKAKPAANAISAKATCNATYKDKDFDGNGYPLDCSGWNVTARVVSTDKVWGDNDASDKIGHGTHVAGIIGARSDDGDGISGVIDNVQIIPVKVITASPTEPVRLKEVANPRAESGIDLNGVPSPKESSPSSEKGLGDLVARGMLYAIRSGAQVINMSLGWPADVDSNLMRQMIDLARSRGILIVAASGNDGTDALIRPCVFEGVICVASHDPDGAISHFSNHGAGVDIAAPGLNILSLFPTTMNSRVFTDRVGYDLKSGTSMASPFIAGLLGRLINGGFSGDEARARLLVSARPVASNERVHRAHEMIVQTGNADLAAAFAAKEQPLILPTSKLAVSAKWDRQQRTVPVKLRFENAWGEAKSVSIQMRIAGSAGQDVKIQPASISAANWKSGEQREFDLSLAILSERLESELRVELQVTSTDAHSGLTKTEKRYVSIEVTSTPASNDRELETRSISGDANAISNLAKGNLRSVLSLDGRNEQDFISLLSSPTGLRLSLLTQEKSSYALRGVQDLPATSGDLLALQRIDLDGDGSSDYVMIWRQAPKPGKQTPTFLFRFFDGSLKPLAMTFDGKTAAEAEYDNSVAVIADTFQWISVGNGRKVPAWITRGTTPESEVAAYDPWNPTPIDFPDFRIYYWGAKGLATISMGDKIPVAFFPASPEEMRSGRRRAMWLIGNGTDATYEMTEISNLKSTEVGAIDFGGYRRLRSTMMAPIFDANSTGSKAAGETMGVGFYSNSYRSASRVSAYVPNQGLLFDKILTPMSQTDAVGLVLAAFSGSSLTSVISQTIYEMQYEDIRTGEKATASLKRFSFMPEFFFQRLFFPVLGDDSQGGRDRLPMIYLAQGLGTGNSIEVLAPRYESGKLQGFVRPARLRLVAPRGCESMGNVIAASAEAPSRVVFSCPDRILFVPLKY